MGAGSSVRLCPIDGGRQRLSRQRGRTGGGFEPLCDQAWRDAWSLGGQHTGRTDIPPTDKGASAGFRDATRAGQGKFRARSREPMQRARETCELAGLGGRAEVEPDLLEWNYGDYEGLTPSLLPCPAGETPEEVGGASRPVIARARTIRGDALLFGHGHALRVLAARWLGLPTRAGQHFLLSTGALSVLGYYHEIPAVKIWNARW